MEDYNSDSEASYEPCNGADANDLFENEQESALEAGEGPFADGGELRLTLFDDF